MDAVEFSLKIFIFGFAGAPVDGDVKGEPDILTKALITREIAIAKAIAAKTQNVSIDSAKLKELYSISCNPTPLVKLLLHADTIVRDSPPKTKGVKGIKKLLAQAYLEGQQPVVQAKDLGTFSDTHTAVLTRLGGKDEVDIMLHEIMDSMAEVADQVHSLLLKHKNGQPAQLAAALATVQPGDRNPLHTLALAGSAVMINGLATVFEKAGVDMECKATMRKALTSLGE